MATESFVGTFTQPQEAQRKTLLLTNTQVSATWLSAHDVINRPNNVLANLGKLDTPAQQASAEGEAKFIRSLVYFNLVSTRLVFPFLFRERSVHPNLVQNAGYWGGA